MDPKNRKNILVAEDDPVAQVILKNNLKQIENVEVTVVGDGKEALSQCLKEDFDMIIVDLNLPSLKGTRLISFLRTSVGKNKSTPTMLLSAHTKDEIRAVKGSALADAIMSKPVISDEFKSQVVSFIS